MQWLNKLKSTHIFLCIAMIYLTGFFAHALYLKKTVYGDGVYYFSWLRSAVIDHDFNFSDEYRRLGGTQPMISRTVPGNKYAVGPAIFWSPAYITWHTILGGDGYSLPYQLAIGAVSVLSALFGLVLTFILLCKYFSQTVSIVTTAAIAGATNLFFYGSVDAANSHALSFFAASCYVTLLLSQKRQWFAIGIFLGFLGLIRPQDFIFGLALIPLFTSSSLVPLVSGTIVGFLPQLIAWQALYGQFWTSPYFLNGKEGFSFFTPHILGVLFGVHSGLFLWTPIIILAVIGFFIPQAKRVPVRWWLLSVFIAELYAVASWSTWWQGASYSGRMFVSSLPILSFGLASFFTWLGKYRFTQAHYFLTIVGPLSLINATSIVYFLLTLH